MNSSPKNNRVVIVAGIEEMSALDVKDLIGAARYDSIKERDPCPMFVELLAGHEGVSTGKMAAGMGLKRPVKKRWTRERIKELAAKLKGGTPVYVSHATDGGVRKPVGEIVSAAERWVRGLLGAGAIAYVKEQEVRRRIKSGELDVCLIEADVECHRGAGAEDSWIVDAVRKVTGMALGSSRVQKPGFPGAMLLGAVEEFDSDDLVIVDQSENEPGGTTTAGNEADRINELTGKIKLQDQRITELAGEVDQLKKERKQARPAEPGISAPPERKGAARGPADNPLIPRAKGW